MPGVNHDQLSKASVGKQFVIRKIKSSPETNLRLRELGFSENIIIRTISNSSSQLICEINNTRIGIHHRVAKDIFVSQVN